MPRPRCIELSEDWRGRMRAPLAKLGPMPTQEASVRTEGIAVHARRRAW